MKRGVGVYDTAVKCGGWSSSAVLLQLSLHGLASGSSSTRGANPKAYCPKPEHIDMPLGTNNAVLSQC